MLVFYIFIAFFLAFSCAGPKKAEWNPSCPAGFISGKGIGESEQEALALAQAGISSQIRLSLSAASEYSTSMVLAEDKEKLKTEFSSQIEQTTELLNAQDAKLHAKNVDGNRFAVLACMSNEDAAKPYLAKLPSINDSLNLAVQTVLAQSHPRAKKEAARAAENLRMRQTLYTQILHGLGKQIESQEPQEPQELQNSESYEKMMADYKEFSANFKFIWEGSDEAISQILASKISSRYKIETGSCVYGIKLVPVSTEVQCENSSFGPQCSYLPNLEGRSCTGELYFTLKGQMVRGTGLRDEADALRKLHAIIPGASFWMAWFEELDRYR